MCSPRQLFFFHCGPQMPKGGHPCESKPCDGDLASPELLLEHSSCNNQDSAASGLPKISIKYSHGKNKSLALSHTKH